MIGERRCDPGRTRPGTHQPQKELPLTDTKVPSQGSVRRRHIHELGLWAASRMGFGRDACRAYAAEVAQDAQILTDNTVVVQRVAGDLQAHDVPMSEDDVWRAFHEIRGSAQPRYGGGSTPTSHPVDGYLRRSLPRPKSADTIGAGDRRRAGPLRSYRGRAVGCHQALQRKRVLRCLTGRGFSTSSSAPAPRPARAVPHPPVAVGSVASRAVLSPEALRAF